MADYAILRGGDTLLMIESTVGKRPSILHCGSDIPAIAPEEITALQTAQHIPGGPQTPIRPSLLNPIGTGWNGGPGLIAHRAGRDWAIDLRVVATRQDAQSLTIVTEDTAAQLRATHRFDLCAETGVLAVCTEIDNLSDEPLQMEWCAALCLPIDPALDRLTSFNGSWADEFHTDTIERFRGTYLRENRTGRTSHTDFPGLYLGARTTAENTGPAAAFHLGWSGNHRLRIDTGPDGSTLLQAGELLLPGEVELGESYTTPTLYGCWSADGYGHVTRRLHRFVKQTILPANDRRRPVHYNTWEAVYFDHSEERLLALVDAAADVGAERFVLDDGWFGARRSDVAGLGDWWVSPDVYPKGLHPIVDRVRAANMEFGLWMEPEMVNADSDLYRAHPDWVLGSDGVEPIASRNQLPLDLTKSVVADYLYAKIGALIGEYAIDYIKWDMNRDIQHPGSGGKAVMRKQVHALYTLIDQIRADHPALEIESCASGGGRAD
ncbi:MAG: alpha-galactosidase, partial [Pontixanthobacter sp.]